MTEYNQPKPRVCRNLLVELEESDRGNDEDITKKLIENQRRNAEVENRINEYLGTSLQSKIERWNFDFINGIPLEGEWDWNYSSFEDGLLKEGKTPTAETTADMKGSQLPK